MDHKVIEALLDRLKDGDKDALADLFMIYRKRLHSMVNLRLDRRLRGRLDASDVLQDAYLEISRRLPEYVADPEKPFFLWLRFLTGQKLRELHRRHLGVQARDVQREISLYRGALPEASSVALAAQLLGRATSPSHAAARAEMKLLLQDALNSMDALDREILALRHFEELSNAEAALLLEISTTAASNRYIRALKRLRKLMKEIPGLNPPAE
jgi:RNA polymerase sigma-70 factor (ECF subfamily)